MMEISNNEMLGPNRQLALKAFRPAKRCITKPSYFNPSFSAQLLKSYLVCGDVDVQKDVA